MSESTRHRNAVEAWVERGFLREGAKPSFRKRFLLAVVEALAQDLDAPHLHAWLVKQGLSSMRIDALIDYANTLLCEPGAASVPQLVPDACRIRVDHGLRLVFVEVVEVECGRNRTPEQIGMRFKNYGYTLDCVCPYGTCGVAYIDYGRGRAPHTVCWQWEASDAAWEFVRSEMLKAGAVDFQGLKWDPVYSAPCGITERQVLVGGVA